MVHRQRFGSLRVPFLKKRRGLAPALAAVVTAAALLPGAGVSAQPAAISASEGVFRLNQELSLSVGRFSGDRTAFLRHESGNIPSLNPEIELTSDIHLRLSLPSTFRVELSASTGEKSAGSLALGYRDWSLHVGPRQVNLSRVGVSFARMVTGAALSYQPGAGSASSAAAGSDAAGPGGSGSNPARPSVELVAALTSSRTADVTLSGNDSFGPFFLGQRHIVEGSEQIFIGGTRQRRGAGPGDGDYYMDYRGGFVYFNKVVLRHETIRAIYQYEVDDPGLRSHFWAALAGYDWRGAPGGGTRLDGFVLRDELPVGERTILEQSGYTMTAYGVSVNAALPAGRLASTLVAAELEQFRSRTAPAYDSFRIADDDELKYKLRRTPVLYQSERLTLTLPEAGVTEPLERNLDYVIDYYSGEIELTFAPPPDARLEAEYMQVVGPGDASRMEGVESRSRVDWRGGRWSAASWLELATDDYVSIRTHRPPETKLNAGASARYALTDAWSLLGDVAVVERQSGLLARPGVGVGYERDATSGQLRLVGDLADAGGHHVREYTLEGTARWRGFADFRVDFEKELAGSGSWLPERLSAAAAGLAGRLPYAVTYTHGDEDFKEQVEARVTFPATGQRLRGGLTVASRWMFADSWADEPRVVYSAFGNVAYTGAGGGYTRGRVAVALGRLAGTETESAALDLDAGGSWGSRALVDYQLRWQHAETSHLTGPVETRSGHRHLITFGGAFSQRVSGALAYRFGHDVRWRLGRGRTETTEQGVQASLHVVWGPVHTTLSYDWSATDVVRGPAMDAAGPSAAEAVGAPGESGAGAAPASAAAATTKAVQRWRLAAEWSQGLYALKAAAEVAFHDAARERRAVEVAPAYRLSDYAEWWVGYAYVWSRDFQDAGAAYEVHVLKTGLVFRM